MKEPSGSRAGRARGWPYVVTGVLFAGICAWISYNDGLFVARLAGNRDALAFFYPLLPDGLIVLCLLALAEAARAGVSRPGWAVAGLLLGIGLTLAMNTYAGVEHSALDAVLDGMVPVVFFIAAEVVLWHVRRGRGSVPVAVPVAAPSRVRLPSVREIRARQNCGPETAKKILAELRALERGRGDPIHNGAGSAPATRRGRDGASPSAPPAVPAAAPAGDARPAPAGALNGSARRG